MLKEYLSSKPLNELSTEMVAFTANLEMVARGNPQIAKSILQELIDQRSHLKLIASENYCSLSTQSAMGNLLTDKYAEGFVGNRFYAGCDNVDNIEAIACEEAKKLFGAEHAYVQPHSGADANLVAFLAVLRKKFHTKENILTLPKEEWEKIRTAMGNQRLLGMGLYSGGHLTHGYRHNVSAQLFEVFNYDVNEETGLLDYDNLRKMLQEVKPLIFLIGFSAYTRNIDYSLLRQYADEVGAVMVVDMAHFAGLVAGGAIAGKYNPVPYADIVTTTTHKTLRGPRGGMVLCKQEYAEFVDKGCPHVLGGPLPHVMAAKAIAFKEANTPEYKAYAAKVIENSSHLAAALVAKGIHVQTGGTDNHIVLINVEKLGITGRQAELALRECGLTLNRNTLPGDKHGPWYTSGLRFGTPATTSLGMGKPEMEEIADIIATTLKSITANLDKNGNKSKAKYTLAENTKENAIKRIHTLLNNYVLYPEIDAEFLKKVLN
ncbi:MAG: glycine hydroxymethyltransferase [Defluviitaleaceae bacterium]|nr:glycine hydroxymethyltransferase [Defluviitaleaceae bacterium]